MKVSKALTLIFLFFAHFCISQKVSHKYLINKIWTFNYQPKNINEIFSKDTITLNAAGNGSQLIFLKGGRFHFLTDAKQKLPKKTVKECDLKKGCGQWSYNNTKELIGFWLYDYDTTSTENKHLWNNVTTYFYKIHVLTNAKLILVKQTAKLKGHINVRTNGDTGIVREHLKLDLRLRGGTYCLSGLDKNLEFSYDGLQADTTEIRLTSFYEYKDTIIRNIIINNYKTTLLEISYPPYCEFDKTKNDSVCPVCRKQDQVKRIIYEPYYNPPKGKGKRNKYWTEHNFRTGCDPNWYCQRDDKKF